MNPVTKQVNRVNSLSAILIIIFFCLTTTLYADTLAQYEAEACQSLPNSGWEIVTNDGETALLALESNILGPPDEYRLDFSFSVPDGVTEVFVFAEIDVNQSNNDDSFWVTMNRTSTCNWNNLSPLGDSWVRSWVFNLGKDSQHAFPVNSGTVNSLSIYPRENGAVLNWVVITTDPNIDLSSFSFTGSPPPSTDEPVISLSTAELYFTGEAGQNDLTPQTITVNNGGLGSLSWQAQEVSNANWLAIDNTIGGAEEQITVTANITGMVAGTYQTTIEVWDDNAGNSPQTVPVALTITSETPTLRVSPDMVTFSATAGSDNPEDQSVQISNTGGGTLNWSATEVPDAAWLTLANTSGSNDDVITLSANIDGLDIGLHSAIVRINDPNSSNQSLDIPVTLTVQLGEDGSVIAEIEAEWSPSLPNDAWETTVNDGKNCLYVKTSATTGPTAEYRLDYPIIVPEGVYTVYIFGEVDVNGSSNDDSFFMGMNNDDFCNWGPMANVGDGWNRRWVFDYGKDSQHAFAVQPGVNILNLFPRENGAFINWLVVTADPNMRYQLHNFTPSWTPPTHAPLLVPSPTHLSFEGTVGQSNPAAQILTVGDYGDGTLSWSATTTAAWLSFSKSSGLANETISINVNISGLAAGEYTTNIRLTDPSASNSPVDVPVTLTVIGTEPQIATSVNTLLFRAIAGGTSPSNKKILVTNAAGGTLNWDAQEYPETSWMSLSNTTGQSGEEITVSINISGLSGGTYTSKIRITDPNAINDPVDIPITLSMGPNIIVTTENFGGNGSDGEPFLIHQQTMKFHVDLTEDQKAEDVRYWVQVHMASYRSCTTQYQEKDLSWQQLEGREFEYTADMTGWYYLRVDVERDGVYNEEARTHVYVETPPLKPYTLPYTPPAWNVLPQPSCDIMNAVSGTGDYTNPYKLDSPIIQFRIDGSTDPNGEDDLRYGLFLWAIHMHGGLHPVYCKDENEPLAKNTFLYYDEMKGAVYDWDMRERPSTTNYYIIYVPVIDQWGQVNIVSKHILYDTPYEKEVAIINPSATQVNFTATEGGSNPTNQFVTISNSGASILGWKATDTTSQSWLSLPQYLGSDDHQLELAVNTDGLSAGTYQATVQINDQFSINETVDIPVTLTITDGTGVDTTDDILAQLEAEGASGLPNSGWEITTNENETCLQSLVNDIMSPPADYRLDYTFFVPDGVSTVYLFGELDVNADGNDDSFWVQVNDANTCTWNNLRTIGDGWKRAWVYNQGKDTQHAFPVTPGMNTISFYPRENGAFINWLVVTSNSEQDIQNFAFTGVTPPPVETPVLTVSPAALTFSGEPDGANPANQLLTVQNTGSGTMAWTAAEQPETSWLTLTNTSGGNVGQITVTVNSDGMSAGTYAAQIVLNSNEAANTPVSVPVQLILSTATPVIVLSPPAISFSGVEGGASPAIQQVTITNGGTGELSWSAEKTENTNWLSLADTTGNSGEKLSLQANITGLSAGTYQTTVSIADANAAATPQTLAITLVVEAENTNPSILAELEAEGSADLPNSGWETLVNDGENCITSLINNITSPPGAYRLDYTFNVPAGTSTIYIFGEVDVNNDGNDDSFWVQVNGGQTCTWNNLRALGDGWKRDWVYNQGKDLQHAFAVNTGENTVSFYPRENGAQLNWLVVTTDKDLNPGEFDFSGTTTPVPTTPVLSVSPTTMAFSTVLGATTPMAKVLTIQNTGAGTMAWTALEVPENSWLTLSTASGTNSGSVNVICNPSGLTTGSYDATVRISAPTATNSSVDVTVSMVINNEIPTISVTPASLTFNTSLDGPNPLGQGLTITNTGEGALNWTAAEFPEQVWLNLTNTSGTDGQQVMVSVVATDLPAGSFSGVVRISDTAASNNPLDVPVTFTVVEAQPNTAILAEFQAENSVSLPNSGWSEVVVENQTGIQAEVNDISAPPVPYKLDYGFCVPEGVTTVYAFASIDNNHNTNDDSFWITLNGGQKTTWNGTYMLGYDWVRSWVYNQFKNTQQAFAVSTGDNVLNIYPRENGAKINWLVLTTDPNLDIQNYVFGSGMPKYQICCPEGNSIIPERYHLMQNYPNPFNPETTISFSMPEFGRVRLVIYNTLGQEVIQLFNDSLAAGNYQLHWNGRNAKGHFVSSGLYMCQMKAADYEQVIRMQFIQ